jgi:hypothetical protein
VGTLTVVPRRFLARARMAEMGADEITDDN